MKNMTDMHINEELYREIAVEDDDSGMSSAEWMTDPFNPSKINITQQSPTISNLVDIMKQDPSEIDLNTEFQRSGDLWNPEKQSKPIESIGVKFPLPAFYFVAESDTRWLIVDGLQRLCCIN